MYGRYFNASALPTQGTVWRRPCFWESRVPQSPRPIRLSAERRASYFLILSWKMAKSELLVFYDNVFYDTKDYCMWLGFEEERRRQACR